MSAIKTEIKRKLQTAVEMMQNAIKLIDAIPETDSETLMAMVEQQSELINIILKGVVNGKIEKDDVLDNKFLQILHRMKEQKKEKINVEMDALQTELEVAAADRFRKK